MRLFLHELTAQQRIFWRSREAAFFTFLLPIIFLVLLGSIESMPAFLRAIAGVLPLTYLLELMRHVFLEEDALSESLGAIAVVSLWGAVGVVLALRMFRWEPREGMSGT